MWLKIKKGIIPLFFILLIAYIVKLPLIGYCGISPEGAINFDIARNILSGKLLLSIKENYFTSLPIVHTPIGERGIIYPYLISLLMHLSLPLQIINQILFIICAILFFLIITEIFDSKVAYLSLIWFLFQPRLNLISGYLWNFYVVLTILLISTLILIKVKGSWGIIIAGLVMGLSLWAEPWCIFMPIPFIIGVSLWGKTWQERVKNALQYILGLLVMWIPYLIMTYKIYGVPFPLPIYLYFQILDYNDYFSKSYTYQTGGMWYFIGFYAPKVIERIIFNIKYYAYNTFWVNYSWLFTLSGVISIIIRRKINDIPQKYIPLFVFSALSFVGISFLWSKRDVIMNPLFVLIFIVPLIFHWLNTIKIKNFPLGFILCVLVVSIFASYSLPFIHNQMTNRLKSADLSKIMKETNPKEEYIVANTSFDENICAVFPWLINLRTGRPCGALPINLNSPTLYDLAEQYHVKYFIDNGYTPISEILRRNLKTGSASGKFKEVIEGLWRVL